MKKLLILGVGGNCIDILDAVNEINLIKRQYEVIGFLDDNRVIHKKDFCGVPVLGPLSIAPKFKNARFVNGIGSDRNFHNKEKIINKTQRNPELFETIIHPSASVSSFSKLGHGVVILQNATVASRVEIGNHVMILANTVINHDCIVGDYSCFASGVCLSGGCKVGKSCYLGANCSIKGNAEIGDHSLIGMGAVVTKKVPSESVYVGNPANFLRHMEIR